MEYTAQLFLKLNNLQREAVMNTEGPSIIISGAGAGKTRVLTYRIAYLIQKGIPAVNILSLTFTNKAAREMKERIINLVGELEAKKLWIGTFHSIFTRILRRESNQLGFPSNFIIYDTQDSLNILKKVIIELNLNPEIYNAKKLQLYISQYKNSLISFNKYPKNNINHREFENPSKIHNIREIYKKYVEKCFKNEAMDFDDLLLKTYEVFTRFPKILIKYQNFFRYILVDEYQDTNQIQYLIIKKLASQFKNICVVGDDAQSIYAFRGANIDNILNFKNDYPNAKIILLEQNYRSTQIVVNAANSIISNNSNQISKNIWTLNPKGEKITIYRAFSDINEANFIVNSIFELKKIYQIYNKEFAILYRTNAQSRALEDALRKKCIPYNIYGSLSFYQRKEIKDLLAYLRVLINPKDEEALLRIINFPTRGIGNSTINKIIISAQTQKIPIYKILDKILLIGVDLKLSQKAILKLYQFWKLIKTFQNQLCYQDLDKVVMQLVIESGLMRYFKENKDSISRVNAIENINTLISSIQEYMKEQKKDYDKKIPDLEFFMEKITLTDNTYYQEEEENEEYGKVSLMTVHLAKGLEFPYIYIAGMEEELFPATTSVVSQKSLEEERRLFYVALTRAQKKVFISFCTTRFRWGKIYSSKPSRFLKEINQVYCKYLNPEIQKIISSSNPSLLKNNINLSKKLEINPIENINIGDKIVHQNFGSGIVLFIEKTLEKNIENKIITIDFNKIGTKKISLKFAKLFKL